MMPQMPPTPPAPAAPDSNSESQDCSIMCNLSDLGPDASNMKVGDEVKMTISNIQGDMVTLAPEASDDESEDTDPSTMPLDKLEASLPKADRED